MPRVGVDAECNKLSSLTYGVAWRGDDRELSNKLNLYNMPTVPPSDLFYSFPTPMPVPVLAVANTFDIDAARYFISVYVQPCSQLSRSVLIMRTYILQDARSLLW
jgi:hypothetical protein